MAPSTDYSNSSLRQAADDDQATPGGRVLGTLRRFVARSIFWTYERGSWQYDVICALILAFIFLTPASWFHDRPTLGLTNLRRTQGIIEIGHAKDGWHYIIDARLVDSLAPTPTRAALQEILARRISKPFHIESLVTLRDRNNVILGYTVILKH